MKRGARLWVPLLILLVGVALVSVMFAAREPLETRARPPSTPLVRVITVQPRNVEIVVRTHGTVVPRTESDLIPQVAGEVVWVSANLVSGGFFTKGEPLVRIDRSDHQAELASARASVARFESEFRRNEAELSRQRQLMEKGVTSQARIDDTENAFRVSDAMLREARARLSRAQRDLTRTELRAPYDGRVRTKDVDVGQFVSRGAPVATLYAVDHVEVRLPLPDRELRWLDLPLSRVDAAEASPQTGPLVRFHAEFAGEPRVWTGHVVRTEGEIDAQTRMVNVVARVEDPYGRHAGGDTVPLAVGLFVEAEIVGRTVADAFVLPRATLHPDAVGNLERLHVIDSESRLRIRTVEVLRTDREEVVIGGGLKAGERISISPLRGAVDGMAVRVAEPSAQGDALARSES